MSSALLECKELSKSFEKNGVTVDVLKGVNFSVGVGETVALLGSSGAGKSTLLHVLGTLEPPTSGSIHFMGKNLSQFRGEKLANFRNREIGFVFQFHYLLQEFTALENVLMPALIAGASKDEFRKRAEQLLVEVGLKDRLHHRPAELSGGEQQRVALARAMVMNPRLLLADEPTGNLDSANAHMVKDLFLHLSAHKGVSVLFVTHDEEMAKDMTRKVVMKDGQIVLDSAL
ncbi:MAG: ABC transporter ATP-binding protein [Oligoflexia bacterium]|nr:ABC transporter ATP-binding protein [Oligoflexia bacterium]